MSFFVYLSKVDREDKILGLVPRVRFLDKSTYTNSHTKEYDMVRRLLSGLLRAGVSSLES
jgi:hypothetical protein